MPAAKPVRYQLTFLVLCMGTLGYAVLQSMVSPVLPLLESELHTSQNNVTWVLTAYLLSASVFTPILGRLGDMYGKKKVMVAVLSALAIGSVVAAVATSIVVMIVARVIQGIGGGLIPIAFGIIRDEFPRDRVAGAVGVIAALIGVGGGLGLVLAGPIVDALDYHWLFWIPAIVVAICVIACVAVVPESAERTEGGISWSAAALLSAWLILLLLAISQAPDWGWGSAAVIGLIVAALVLAVAWIQVELRVQQPLIDMRMMRIPAVWATNLVGFLFGIGMYSVFAFVPELLQMPTSTGYGFGEDVTKSGLLLAPMMITMFVFGVASGPLSRALGAKAVLIIGSAVTVPGFVVLAYAHGQLWTIALAVGLLGIGVGLAFSAMSAIIVASVPSRQTGVASGMNANIRTIGGSVGAAVTSSIVTTKLLPSGLPTESGFTNGFAVLAAATFVAALAGFLIPRLPNALDVHQVEQAHLAHAELAIVAGGTVVGDDPE